MLYVTKKRYAFILAFVLMSCHSISACAVEFMPFIGKVYSGDLRDANKENDISLDDTNSIGFAISWQESSQGQEQGQGQVVINFISHDFKIADTSNKLDIIYAHFNGVAHFQMEKYVTTFAIGIGGTHFDAAENKQLHPSITAALGTRYEISQQLSFVTELRGYVTWVDEDDDLFCQKELCSAHFDEALWIEGMISVGLAYKF